MKRPAAIAASLAVWLVGVPLAHGAVPWAIGQIPPSFAGPWSRLGLVPLAFGTLVLAWVALTGLGSVREMPGEVSLDWQPKVFLARGPYAHTRNPMYVAELALWLGWAIWTGSPLVLLGGVLLFAAMQRMVRREERDLATHFGDAYRAYCSRVPRWLGHAS